MKKKISILFDAEPMASGTKSGVGYYTDGIIHAMAAANPESLELIGHYYNFRNKRIPILPTAPNERYIYTRRFPRQIPYALRRKGKVVPYETITRTRADFLFFPGFIGFPSKYKTPYAPVIHDLTYLDYPEYVSPRNQRDLEALVPGFIKQAAFVVVVSEATKTRLLHHYRWLKKPVIVQHTPPPKHVSIASAKAASVREEMGITGNYILSVGTIEPRKNLTGLIQAYTALPAAVRSSHALVLAGGKGWHDEVTLQAIQAAQAKGHTIIQTGYVSNQQKAALYEGASLAASVSFYEGYALPLLEAMDYGVPVVASNIDVFTEVAKNAAVFCDPNDPTAIADALHSVLTDDAQRTELITAGTARVQSFSWDKAAAVLVAEIRKAVG